MTEPDSELEEDEEEILVYVEFDNFATNDVFSNENLKLDMLGLDSDHPIMQINGKFFEGTYENAPGTYLFFEKDYNPEIDDPIFDKVPTLKYCNKTRKLLRMQRAFLVPRYEVIGDSNHNKCIPNKDTLKEAGVPPAYHKEAFSFWKNLRNNRLDALGKYLKKQEFRKELRLRGFEPDSESDEDNPFAMYKYMDNQLINVNKDTQNRKDNTDFESQEEKSKNIQEKQLTNVEAVENPKKLTVIDPGPSTSKSSSPWIDNDTAEELCFSKKVKNMKRPKSKVAKGKISKRILMKSKGFVTETSKNIAKQSLKTPNNNHLYVEAEENMLSVHNSQTTINNKPKPWKKDKKKISEEMEIDEIAIEESERLLAQELKLNNDNLIFDKKKQKQEKREAKMREISEKLKAINENSSQTNS